MKLEYFPDTDSLYIDFAERGGVDVVEVGDGFVVDVDDDGRPVGIDIDQASRRVDLLMLELRCVRRGPEAPAR